MKTIIRNFTSIFRKFVTANLLNLLGLSLAFASFFVIMTQVNYDQGYNKSFTEHERLFRLTMELGSGMEDYGVTLPAHWWSSWQQRRRISRAMASNRAGSSSTSIWWTIRSIR